MYYSKIDTKTEKRSTGSRKGGNIMEGLISFIALVAAGALLYAIIFRTKRWII